MINVPKKYTIARVCITEDGDFWFSVVGDCVQQGGPQFGWTQYGSNLEGGLSILQRIIEEHKELYLSELKQRKETQNVK